MIFLGCGVFPLISESGPETRAGSLGVRARGQEIGADTCPLVGGDGSWALWWAGLCIEAAVDSGGLKPACLLVGGAVSPPS